MLISFAIESFDEIERDMGLESPKSRAGLEKARTLLTEVLGKAFDSGHKGHQCGEIHPDNSHNEWLTHHDISGGP